MGTTSTDAAVRSIVVRATTINTLWGEAQLNSPAEFRCEHCGRRQFFKEGRQKCIVCRANIPQGKIFRPPSPRQGMGPWICKRLRSVRLQKGATQKKLAARVPCMRSYISKYENLRCIPTQQNLEKLALALDVEMWELLDRNLPVSQFAKDRPILDASQRASIEALMVEVTELLPKLCAGARETLLLAARGLVNGQRTFDDWLTIELTTR